MTINKTFILAAVVILETVIILLLVVAGNLPRLPGVRLASAPVVGPRNPLELAIEYESPDRKFEELVQQHRGWLQYTRQNDGLTGMSILSACAMVNKTNYVRILIANGADVNEALGFLKQFGTEDALKLLQQLAAGSTDK